MDALVMDDPSLASTEKMKELRQLMLQTLDKQGVLSGVRASLRAGVFCALHEQQKAGGGGAPVNEKLKALRTSDYGALAAALVKDFLVAGGLDHTLSVFNHEIGDSFAKTSSGGSGAGGDEKNSENEDYASEDLLPLSAPKLVASLEVLSVSSQRGVLHPNDLQRSGLPLILGLVELLSTPHVALLPIVDNDEGGGEDNGDGDNRSLGQQQQAQQQTQHHQEQTQQMKEQVQQQEQEQRQEQFSRQEHESRSVSVLSQVTYDDDASVLDESLGGDDERVARTSQLRDTNPSVDPPTPSLEPSIRTGPSMEPTMETSAGEEEEDQRGDPSILNATFSHYGEAANLSYDAGGDNTILVDASAAKTMFAPAAASPTSATSSSYSPVTGLTNSSGGGGGTEDSAEAFVTPDEPDEDDDEEDEGAADTSGLSENTATPKKRQEASAVESSGVPSSLSSAQGAVATQSATSTATAAISSVKETPWPCAVCRRVNDPTSKSCVVCFTTRNYSPRSRSSSPQRERTSTSAGHSRNSNSKSPVRSSLSPPPHSSQSSSSSSSLSSKPQHRQASSSPSSALSTGSSAGGSGAAASTTPSSSSSSASSKDAVAALMAAHGHSRKQF